MGNPLRGVRPPERLGVLTSTFPRWQGDYQGNWLALLSGHLARRFRVQVLAPDGPGLLRQERWEGVGITRFRYWFPPRCQGVAYGDGIENNLHPLRALQLPPFLLSFLLKGLRLARESDALHSHWLFPGGLVGGFARWLFGTPHLLTVHSVGGPWKGISLRGPTAGGRTPGRALRGLLRFVLFHSDGVTTVSRHTRHALRALMTEAEWGKLEDKVHILPMGVRAFDSSLKARRALLRAKYGVQEPFVLLYLGRLIPIKGVSHLIQAAGGLKEFCSCEGLRLLIAGEGPLAPSLKKLSLERRVRATFLGPVSGVEKDELLALSDVLVVPSVALPSGRQEGLPVVVLEGLAAGLPIVASDTGGIGEVICQGENGLLVPPGETGALSRSLRRIWEDGRLRARLAEGARESSKTFHVEAVGGKFQKLIEEILRKGRGGSSTPKTEALTQG